MRPAILQVTASKRLRRDQTEHKGRGLCGLDDYVHTNYESYFLRTSFSRMSFTYVLGYTICSRKIDEAPIDRAFNVEFLHMDGKMLPSGATIPWSRLAVIPPTNLPVATALRPVIAEDMDFPRVQSRRSVVDPVAEITTGEWAKEHFWNPFRFFRMVVCGGVVTGAKGEVVVLIWSFLGFLILILVIGRGEV